MSQAIRMIVPRNRKRKSKYVAVNRNSIGVLHIGGGIYTYNLDLMYDGTAEATIDRIIEDSQKKKRKKKVIRIRRK